MSIPGYWTSGHNPAAARVRRASSAGVSQSNKRCQAFIPFGPRLYVTAARRSVNVAMNFRYEHWSSMISYLVVKTEHRPQMVLHVSNHGTFSMRLHFNLWSISQQIRSCYADQHALIGILRYMYMPWPLNSWGNDGVSAYSYWIKVPIPTWPIMIHHDASWPIMILDFYADSIWFCCFFSSFFAGELALRGGDLAASATNIATDLVAGLRCLAPCSRSVHSIIELNWLWCQSLWFLKLYVKKYVYIYI